MQAEVLTAENSVTLKEQPTPTPDSGEVLVEVDACGVCMTDYHMYHGTFPVETPVVLGHESTGTVVEYAEDVTSTANGDRVALYPSVPCWKCTACREGSHNQCQNLVGLGAAADSVRDGSFAEYVAVPASSLVPASGLSPDVAALTEPLACCIHAVDRTALTTGDTVVLIGAGPIGLLLLQVFREAGASKLVVSEPIESRRTVAADLGADVVLDPNETNLKTYVDAQIGSVDIAAEVVGLSHTIEQAVGLPSPGGETLIFGVPPQDATIEVNPFDIYYDERDILGTFGSTLNTMERAVTMLHEERIETEPLVTDRYALGQLSTAFDEMEQQQGLKKLILP